MHVCTLLLTLFSQNHFKFLIPPLTLLYKSWFPFPSLLSHFLISIFYLTSLFFSFLYSTSPSCLISHSLTHSFTQLTYHALCHSLTHSCTLSFATHSCTLSSTRSLTHISLTHSFINSFSSCTLSFNHSFMHSFICPLIHARFQSLAH